METKNNPLLRMPFSDVFNINYLAPHFMGLHTPISFDANPFRANDLWGHQKLHYMIKPRDERKYYIDTLLEEIPEIKGFIYACDHILNSSFLLGLAENRYAYLTIDTRSVTAGTTQRAPGWHIECVQGDEVPVKKSGNIAFNWCDSLPMQYAQQRFNMNGFDLSKHNIFKWLGDQVKLESIKSIDTNKIVLMNNYCVHRAKVATEFTKRRYVRSSYTHVPITNHNAHINPDIKYDYPVHSTDGKIPKHLI